MFLLTLGALTSATGVLIFLLPHQIAPSGVSGVGVILNSLMGMPVGLVIVLGNLPIQFFAYRELSGWRSVLPTVYAVALYSLAIELMPTVVTITSISDDQLLNAIFGGLVTGLGGGLAYRAGGSVGGTATLAQVLRHRFGWSLSTSSLFTDGLVLAGAGLVFGWEEALYALIVLFLNRSIADYVLDGSKQSFTAIIVSQQAKTIARAVDKLLDHQATAWQMKNTNSGQEFTLLMITLRRPELHGLRQLIERIDTEAYVTVLETHAVYGENFQSVASHLPFNVDQVEDSVSRRIRADSLEEFGV